MSKVKAIPRHTSSSAADSGPNMETKDEESKTDVVSKIQFGPRMSLELEQLFHEYYEAYDSSKTDSVIWLENNHYIVRKVEEVNNLLSQETKAIMLQEKQWRYTLWSGGTIFLPKNKRTELFELIADDIANGRKVYYNERGFVDEGMRFMVDVDSKRLLTKAEILILCQHMYDVLASYYTQFATNPIPIFYSVSGPRIKNGIFCTSLHLVAHVAVTLNEARQMTRMILYKIHMRDDLDMTHLVLDDQIYKDTNCCHLRMIYSLKRETCPVCLNISPMGCPYCKSSGFVVSKFPYIPKGAIANRQRSKELFDEYHKTWLQMLLTHSVTVNDIKEWRSDYQKPPEDPVYELTHEMFIPPKNNVPGRVIEKNAPTHFLCGKGDIPSRTVTQLTQFIRQLSWMDETGQTVKPWAELIIMEIKRSNQKSIALINFLRTTGASYCCYANRDHSSNRIYMTLSAKGVLTVRCHSPKCSNVAELKKFENVSRSIVDEVFQVPTKDRMPPLQITLPKPA